MNHQGDIVEMMKGDFYKTNNVMAWKSMVINHIWQMGNK
jgi:hypothetical protein